MGFLPRLPLAAVLLANAIALTASLVPWSESGQLSQFGVHGGLGTLLTLASGGGLALGVAAALRPDRRLIMGVIVLALGQVALSALYIWLLWSGLVEAADYQRQTSPALWVVLTASGIAAVGAVMAASRDRSEARRPPA